MAQFKVFVKNIYYMKLFSIELDTINGSNIPRVELNNKFRNLESEDILLIHNIISKCYIDVMRIYISKESNRK